MPEYDWRKEREKFRPDFMKQQAQPAPSAAAPQPQPNAPIVRRSSGPRIIAIAVVAALLIAGLTALGIKLFSRSGEDHAAMLAKAAEQNKKAVGLVVLTMELPDGTKRQESIGTAWAFAPDKFATNAHVANGLKEMRDNFTELVATSMMEEIAKSEGFKDSESLLKRIGKSKGKELMEQCVDEVNKRIRFQASILINGEHHKSYPISHVQIHRNYGLADTSFDPDVAVLTIDGEHDAFFKIADADTLAALKSGDPIAFLGFPMENMQKENVNLDNPVASMQSGIVVAVSDFDFKDAGAKGNYMIRHNLPTTGGASGSPVFNKKGDVIALVYAGNIIGQTLNGKVTRAPSAAQINFAVRSDLLNDMGKKIRIQEFLKDDDAD